MTIYQSVECQKIVVGTCLGSKEDAEDIARGYIERYLVAGDARCRYYLHEEKGVGYHYEIHQGGSGRAYLPALMEVLSEVGEAVVIEGRDRYARVWRRANGSLSCLWLSSEDQAEEDESKAPSSAGLSAGPRMRAYRKKSSIAASPKAVLIGGLVALGLVVTVAAFLVSNQLVNADTLDYDLGGAYAALSR